LRQCSECSEEVEQIQQLYPGLEHLSQEHIPPETLVDYVNLALKKSKQIELGEWKEEQILEHVEVCEHCQSEFQKLKEFKEESEVYDLGFGMAEKKRLPEIPLEQKIYTTYAIFLKFLRSRKIQYALAAAAVVALIAIPVSNWILRQEKEVVDQEVKKAGLLALLPKKEWVKVDKYPSSAFQPEMQTRGGKQIADYSSAKVSQEAAIQELRLRIKLVSGKPQFFPAKIPVESKLPHRLLLLKLVDQGGKSLKELTATIPIIEVSKDTFNIVEAWLIAFPSRELYRVEMTADSVETIWTPGMGEQIGVTFTYKVGNFYKTTPVIFADMRERRDF
ncbi:MAG: hypothetical protein ACRENF_00245, partial [Thermodesulfobacteriota bacterium]